MAELKVLIQREEELDVEKVAEFISVLDSPRLVLFFSSIHKSFMNLDFFQKCMDRIELPFLGAKVIYCGTNSGFIDNVLVVCVFCGNCSAEVFSVDIDYAAPFKTAERINSTLRRKKLMIAYSSNVPKKDAWVNQVFKIVQQENPGLQIVGGVCSIPPFVATKEGVFEDRIGYAVIDGLDFDFIYDSGFRFDEDSIAKYVVTKSDDYHLLELNGKNASEEYSKIQHLRPYFLNMLSSLFVKSNFPDLMKTLSNTNTVMYDGIMKFAVKLLGTERHPGIVEILAVFELGGDYLLAQSSFPKGTVLRRVTSIPDDQMKTYDRLKSKAKKPKAILINSCLMRAYWLDFQFKKIKEKIGRFDCPVIEVYLWGELGSLLPYKNPEINILNGGTMKSLVLK